MKFDGIEIFIALAILFSILFVLAFIGYETFFATKISFIKSEWQCTEFHTTLVPYNTGQSIVLIPQQQCTNYKRI